MTSEASEEVQRLLPPETAIPSTSSMRPAAIYTTTSVASPEIENEKSVPMSRAGMYIYEFLELAALAANSTIL